jgi:DNA-binding LytR/AlgR family response regulator
MNTESLAHPPKVIVNASGGHLSVKAFDLEAINHLMEPDSIKEFVRAMTRLGNLRDPEETPNTFITPEYVYFRQHRKMVKVVLNDILFVESARDYITVHTEDNPPLRIKEPISALEAILPPKRFLRIHRSYIISLQKITAFTHYDVEIGRLELPIGRKYKEVYHRLKAPL